MDIDDLIAQVGVAPRTGQTPTLPVGMGGWAKAPIGDSKDLQRILHIARRPQPGPEKEKALIRLMTGTFRRERDTPCNCHNIRDVENPCLLDLRFAQSWALFEMGIARGLIGAIGVGHGKTLLDILSPLAMPGCKTALLLVKPDLVEQLVLEYRLADEHFRVPDLMVHVPNGYTRIREGHTVLHVMPLSRLSRKSATGFMRQIDPDFIIVDEVQRLKDRDTATASRVFRYFRDNWETTRFAGWTGTLTDKSLNDYGHLLACALGLESPLPLDPTVLDDWARAIDPSDFPAPAGKLFAMCEPGESIESGYCRRLTETLGVVATTRAAIDAHLVITERKAPSMPHVVKDALESIRNFVRPDGEELVEAYEVAISAKQAACGFYYRWKFTHGETEAQINTWLSARKAWNRDLRNVLQDRQEHMDSPLLCQEAAVRAWSEEHVEGLPDWKAESWPAWAEVKGTVRPETEAVWLDDFLAQDAANWGLKNKGVIWYIYNAFGIRVGELSGLPVHGGGKGADLRIADETGDKSIIASIHAHGTGRDGLQRLFKTQLITAPPSSGAAWEQLLGRLHRIGQESSVVSAEVYRHTEEFKRSLDKALARALYIQDTLGSEQKLRVGYELE